jgi:GNAT superfamily N-acetyltransferase
MTVEIRPATIEDVHGIARMGLNFLAATRYHVFASSEASLSGLIHLVLEHGAAFVAEDGPTLVGMIGLIAGPHPLTGEPYADEVCWWVEPGERARGVGPRLLQAAETWAETNGLDMLKMAAPEGSDVGRFYILKGYEAVETIYMKRFSEWHSRHSRSSG